MNPRTERHIRRVTSVVIASAVAGLTYALIQGYSTVASIATAIGHGVAISLTLSIFEVFVQTGAARDWVRRLPFTVSFLLRSAIYAAVILAVQVAFIKIRSGSIGPDRPPEFWNAAAFSAIASIAVNFVVEISNLLGRRTFSNFLTGRYHNPVEENRFVLFVDIVGSTSLAERLGGIGIHRFLDRTFRVLTESVVDYRGEVLDYVGDGLIVTGSEAGGAVDCRPLRCFLAMRDTLRQFQARFEKEFGVAPRIRGSLHFGPVIVGEIGDIKRAIVFNGDVMNTAARLEELSRDVDGGFVASRAAIDRFKSEPPIALLDLGVRDIRGRSGGIAVTGLA